MILLLGTDYSPGIRFKTTAEFSYCGQATSPGCCTCRGKFSWRAVTAGDVSYWPGKLIFAGVKNRIILLTFAEEFLTLLLQLRGDFSNKKWKTVNFLYERGKNNLFFVLKREKSILFRIEKCKIFTYSKSKINPSLLLTGEHLFTWRGRKMVPSPSLSFCWVH